MNFNERLNKLIREKKSYLCVGLDPDIDKIPNLLLSENNPIKKFTEEIINATKEYAVAYKANMAFFECEGIKGLNALESLKSLMPVNALLILDGKRGDIGNTAKKYAKAAFETFGTDAVTVNPYMGLDAIKPFIENAEKGAFVLGLTSNNSAKDFQYLQVGGQTLYLNVANKVRDWNKQNNCGLVVGATKTGELTKLRSEIKDLPFLVPGIGAQGGDLQSVIQFGCDQNGTGLLINVGRDILYQGSGSDFADKASRRAEYYKNEMNKI